MQTMTRFVGAVAIAASLVVSTPMVSYAASAPVARVASATTSEDCRQGAHMRASSSADCQTWKAWADILRGGVDWATSWAYNQFASVNKQPDCDP